MSDLTELDLVALDILVSLKPFAREAELARWGIVYKPRGESDGVMRKLYRLGFYKLSLSGSVTPIRAKILKELAKHPRPTIKDRDGYGVGNGLYFKRREPSE